MLNSKSLKIAFATLFASLTLLLSMFATTGIASAHTNGQIPQNSKDRKCVLIIREHVTFVPFKNLHGNKQWNSWGWRYANQDRDYTVNANSFDTNHGHFNNYDKRDRHFFAGFFIVKVTEILKCNGKVVKVQTFSFIER